jgi:hypothetical protein
MRGGVTLCTRFFVRYYLPSVVLPLVRSLLISGIVGVLYHERAPIFCELINFLVCMFPFEERLLSFKSCTEEWGRVSGRGQTALGAFMTASSNNLLS